MSENYFLKIENLLFIFLFLVFAPIFSIIKFLCTSKFLINDTFKALVETKFISESRHLLVKIP